MTRNLLLRLPALLFLLVVASFGARAAIEKSPSAQPRNRVAIVVGNSHYQSQRLEQLPNAANDAVRLADSLRRLNFEVLVGTDLTSQGFARLLADAEKKVPCRKRDPHLLCRPWRAVAGRELPAADRHARSREPGKADRRSGEAERRDRPLRQPRPPDLHLPGCLPQQSGRQRRRRRPGADRGRRKHLRRLRHAARQRYCRRLRRQQPVHHRPPEECRDSRA